MRFLENRASLILTAIGVWTLLWASSLGATQEFTPVPISLNVREILPDTLLKGKNYSIEERVRNDGVINTYHVTTKYGPFAVKSTAELLIRITELNALSVMEEIDRSEVFGDAVVGGAKATVEGAAALVTSPVETSKQVAKGTGQFFSSIGHSIFGGDPDKDNALAVALGYDAAKRAFAYEFGVDPYSRYEPAMDRLGEIARSAVAGGLTTKVVLASVDHDIVMAMRLSAFTNNMRKLVRDNPPEKLREINGKKLQGMGVDQVLLDSFLNNYSYNPQEETLLVGELERMEGVADRSAFVSLANTATDPSTARVYRIAAQMLAGYHANVKPLARIININNRPMAECEDGRVVLVAPVDYVFWTQEVAQKVNSIGRDLTEHLPGASGKELWVTGKIDGDARKQIEAMGWKLKQDVNRILLE